MENRLYSNNYASNKNNLKQEQEQLPVIYNTVNKNNQLELPNSRRFIDDPLINSLNNPIKGAQDTSPTYALSSRSK